MGARCPNDAPGQGALKAPRLGEESATVMVAVKTYPNPSEKYLETVCVAGVRIDRGQPEWIRLYPVRFRNKDFDRTFKKYDVIEVNGSYHQANDNRPESFRPRQDEMRNIEHLDSKKNWLLRRNRLGSLIGETTMCDLLARNPMGGMATPSPSLGLIKPADIETSVTDGDLWTSAEQAKVNQASEPDLFGTALVPLEPAPYAVRYKYRCASAKCPGQNQKNLDWEVGQAGRRWKAQYGDESAREAMMKRWRDDMLAPEKDIHFYVGNQNKYRRTFSVLGTWYPKAENALF